MRVTVAPLRLFKGRKENSPEIVGTLCFVSTSFVTVLHKKYDERTCFKQTFETKQSRTNLATGEHDGDKKVVKYILANITYGSPNAE